MSMNNIGDIAGGLFLIALVTTIVAHPESKKNIAAIGAAGTSLLRTAMGQKAGGGY